MGEALTIVVLARMRSADDAASVRAMLTTGKRPVFANDWPRSKRKVYEALDALELAEVDRPSGCDDKAVVTATWTDRQSDWSDEAVRPYMRAFADAGALDVFACMDQRYEGDLHFYRWKRSAPHRMHVSPTLRKKLATTTRRATDILAITALPYLMGDKRAPRLTKIKTVGMDREKPRQKMTEPAAAWHADDVRWMQERRVRWAAVQVDLAQPWVGGTQDMKRLRDYFFFGKVDPNYEFSAPESGGPMPLIFEVWLHPERSQAIFDACLLKADRRSLRYSEHYVGGMAANPCPTFDEVAPMFYELFYLHPERKLRARMPPKRTLVEVPIRHRFGADMVWIGLVEWVRQKPPRENPLCRFILSKLENATASDVAEITGLYPSYDLKAFVKKALAIAKSPDDPRFDTVKKLRSMVAAKRLPGALSALLSSYGFE